MQRALAIGVDIGGTRLRAALIGGDGSVAHRTEVPTAAQDGPAVVVQQIARLVATARTAGGDPDIFGVGVCSPGPIDTASGVALDVPTLAGWVDVPIRSLLEAAIGLPVRLENDAIAAAIGEWRFGAGQGHRNLVYATISTGIGGGVIADGRVVRGRRGMAGHIGHMRIVPDGAPCSCGGHGCWEAYGSGTAFTLRLAADGRWTEPRAVFAAAAGGDAAALALVAEEAEWLGVGIANLLHLYSPEIVVLGGGIAANGFDLLAPTLRARVAANAMPAFRDVPVVAAGLGENAGLVGAGALMLPIESLREPRS